MTARQPDPTKPPLPLWQDSPDHPDGGGHLSETFRRLYFNLYTNSNTSRAERIIEDISLLLLLKLANEHGEGLDQVAQYRRHGGDKNVILMPVLSRAFPDLVDAHRKFSLDDDALQQAFDELSNIRLSDAPAHVLGEAFQSLIGPRIRGDKGQFFTPRSLVKAMVKIVAPEPHETVLDPACGTGGFLIETHVHQSAISSHENLLGQLFGVDKDIELVRLASALLRISTGGRSSVQNFNSLDLSQWPAARGTRENPRFDVVLTNPPFGSRIGIRDARILTQYSLGHRWTKPIGHASWQQTAAILNTQDPQILFLELCVRLLKPRGRLGIVLPEGVFGNRGQGYVWDWIRSQGQVVSLLDCPRTTFQPSTDTKTNVLFFKKDTPRANYVRVGVAFNCGHDRRGRSRTSDGRPYPDDFARLAKSYHEPPRMSDGWYDVTLNDPYYLVPRYYVQRGPASRYESVLTQGADFATLGELQSSRLLTIRKGHEVGSDAYGTGDIPFVRTSDISNFEISADPTKSVGQDVFAEFAKQQELKPGDILIVVDGRYRIGATAILTENNRRCVVQSHLRILGTSRPKDLEPYELLFALNLPSVRVRIRDLVFIQSTLGTLGKRLLELKIPILHGDGPWRQPVQDFRTRLRQRDQLLSEITSIHGGT